MKYETIVDAILATTIILILSAGVIAILKIITTS